MSDLVAFPQFSDQATHLFHVDDMTCEHCQARVENAARGVEGVRTARVDLGDATLTVNGGDPKAIMVAVEEVGYPIKLQELVAESCPLPQKGAPVVAETTTAPVQQKPAAVGAGYDIAINGMHCASCVARVERAIGTVPGVVHASVNLVEQRALVQGGDPEQVIKAIIDLGYEAALAKQKEAGTFYLRVQPWPDHGDLRLIIEIIRTMDKDADCAVENGRIRLQTTLHPADILRRALDFDYQFTVEEAYVDPGVEQAHEAKREIRLSWWRAAVAAVVGFGVMAGQMGHIFPTLLQNQLFWAVAALVCLATMWFSGRNYFIGAWKMLKHGGSNMDTLVAMGTGAAWISAAVEIASPTLIPGAAHHVYLDASVMILAFLQFGHALEIRAKRTTSQAISALVGLRARSAEVMRGDTPLSVPVSLLRLGDLVRVKPGEKVPIDGEIVSGQTTIDESMLTGEPLAVARKEGDGVTGGTINRSGSFILQVTRLGEDTTLARIIRLVQTAQMSKPPIGRVVDRIAAVFVPVVICISLITFFCWMLLATQLPLLHALTAAIAVLVIACPCALGLATPIAIMVGTSRAAQCNVLIRNSDALQSASTLTHVVMDKTGTLTMGHPTVTGLHPVNGIESDQLLQWAATLEYGSEHPLASAVLSAWKEKGGELLPLTRFTAVAGHGVRGYIDGKEYFLGSHHFLSEQGCPLPAGLEARGQVAASQGATPILLGRDREVLGLLVLQDPVRADAVEAIQALQAQGLTVVMCTGDNTTTANAVAWRLGIQEVHSEILPEEKLQVIARLQRQGHKVGMVGDGINDAPALAQADTSFALSSGTDVAIENADITLVGNSLMLVSTAIAISHATIRNIRQNLFGALVYNVIGIPLAAGLFYPLTGWLLPPMFASAAMALSSVTVVTNANRLRFFRP